MSVELSSRHVLFELQALILGPHIYEPCGSSGLRRRDRMRVNYHSGRTPSLGLLASPKPIPLEEKLGLPAGLPQLDRERAVSRFNHAIFRGDHSVGLAVYDLKGLRVSDGLCGVAMGGLGFIFGLEHQCYPSVLTGPEVETEAIRNHLDLINLDVHVAPPLKTHQ